MASCGRFRFGVSRRLRDTSGPLPFRARGSSWSFGDAVAGRTAPASGLDERRGRCPDCAMEVLKYQVPTGKWILVDPDPITHSVRPHVPSDVLWTISEGVAVRP
ncbi:DUF6083 domain-containing protein [Streptomyces hydrogenans]|uniref:DUF6083 domain-containing protein n=1 Tax=Streptomyces hydrogenans TaxID=1873719 RepID=UPI001CFEDA64